MNLLEEYFCGWSKTISTRRLRVFRREPLFSLHLHIFWPLFRSSGHDHGVPANPGFCERHHAARMLFTLRMLELRVSQPVSEWSDTWELGGATSYMVRSFGPRVENSNSRQRIVAPQVQEALLSFAPL